MSDSHLTPEQIERCRSFTLMPEEMPAVYAHLDLCAECRTHVATRREERAIYEGVETALLRNELDFREALSDEQIAAYVENTLARDEKEYIDAYLERDASAQAAVQQAQSFHNLIASLPPLEVAPLSSALLNDTTGPILLDGAGDIASAGWTDLPGALVTWAREVVTRGIAPPIDSVRMALESMHRTAVPVRSRGGSTPEPLSPAFTVIRSMPPLFRWQALPNAQEYVVVLARQIDPAHRVVVWKQSAGRQTEISLSAEVMLEPESAYVWQVTATVAEQSLRSPFAWFLTLSAADLQAAQTAEQECGMSLLARVGVLEAYGLYEEALAQMPALTELNPDSPVARAIQEQLRKQFEPAVSAG